MDPMTTYLIAQLGSGFLGGLLGGDDGPQERQSFTGIRGGMSIDPRDLLATSTHGVDVLGSSLVEEAMKPVGLRTTVQSPGGMKGGGMTGLPFDLGMGAGEDQGAPEIPGLTFSGNPFESIGSPGTARRRPGQVGQHATDMLNRTGGFNAMGDDQAEMLEALELARGGRR